MTLKRFTLWLFLLLLFNGASVATEVRCLSQDIASIQGLIPGMSEKEIASAEAYLSVESVTGEDDGGGYIGQKYIFKSFELIVVRGLIDSLRITSPSLIWAGGIKLLMNRDSVEQLLGYAQVFKGENSSQYLVCSSVGDVYAVLDFENNLLQNIEIALDRP